MEASAPSQSESAVPIVLPPPPTVSAPRSPLSSLGAALSSVSCASWLDCASLYGRALRGGWAELSAAHPAVSSAALLCVAAACIAWLLSDVREELWQRWSARRAAPRRARGDGEYPMASTATPSAVDAAADAPYDGGGAGGGLGGVGEVDSSDSSAAFASSDAVRASPVPFSSASHRGGGGGAGDGQHLRHRSAMHDAGSDMASTSSGSSRERDRDRDRERERMSYERYGEPSRRRSRFEDEDDGGPQQMALAAYGGPPSAHYRERDERSERSSMREKERRRREREQLPLYGNGADDGPRYARASMSPTHPHASQSSLSLPSPHHRHHQSFSSVHSLLPPSPSHASHTARESSVSSLPSASMLSSTASYSALSDAYGGAPLSTPSVRGTSLSGSDAGLGLQPSSSVVVIDSSDFAWTLARGCELLKYGKYGSPHVRWFQVQLVNGLARLSWGEPRHKTGGSLNLSKSIRMNDILDVKPGKATAVFRQRGNDKLATDAEKCFSILTQKRSLDLQAKDAQERDRWVRGLRQIASDSQRQQPQLAEPPLSFAHGPPLHHSSAQALGADLPLAQQKLVVTALAQRQQSARLLRPADDSSSPSPTPTPPPQPMSGVAPQFSSTSSLASATNSPMQRPFFTYERSQ